MRQIILFDIDYTLIDSYKIRILSRSSLKRYLKTTGKELEIIIGKYVNSLGSITDFNANDFINFISDSYKTDPVKLRDIFYRKEHFVNSLYSETIITLKTLKKKYNLGIFSEGFDDFQMQKLKLSNIRQFFKDEYIFIFRRKTLEKNIINLPVKSIIIDDNREVLEKLKKFVSFKFIWINRKDKKIHPEIKTIFSLKDLDKIDL